MSIVATLYDPFVTFRRATGSRRDEMGYLIDIVDGSSDLVDPCAGCDEETAVGTILYGGRHDLIAKDGRRLFLCDECYAKAHAAAIREGLPESDMRIIAKNGLAIGASLLRR